MGNWDNDIDEVARQMTEGAPGQNFKAQVLARIDADNSGRGSRRLAWTGPAVALAATGALVLMSVRPVWKTEVRPEPDTTYGRYSSSGAETDTALKRGTEDPASRATSPRVFQGRSYGMSGFSGTGAAAPRAVDRTDLKIALDVDRLQPLPIEVEQLAVDGMETIDAIQVQGLDIAPLDVPALAIALLDVPALGDQSFEGRVR